MNQKINLFITTNKVNSYFFYVFNLILYIYLFWGNTIQINSSDKFYLFILTFFSSILSVKSLKNKIIMPYFKKNIFYFTLFIIISTTFASIGNFLFLYPLNIESISNWLYFLVFSFWVTPVILSILYLLEYFQSKFNSRKINEVDKKKSIKIWLLFFSICIISNTLFLLAYNPAIMTYDSFDQISQAKGITPLFDWHPILHTLLIKFLLDIIPSPTIIIIFQMVFISIIISTFLMILYKRGFTLKFLLFFTVIFINIPTNGFHIVTLWKDIPYSISILWLTLVFTKIIYRNTSYTRRQPFIYEICLALTCVYFFRQNGIFPYILSIFIISIILFKRKHYLSILSVLSTIIIIVGIQSYLYKTLTIHERPKGRKYIGLINDLVGVSMSNGNLSIKTKKYLENVLDLENYKKSYSPYWAASAYIKPDLDKTAFLEFIALYIDTFTKNPFQLINYILCRSDIYWNITTGKHGFIGLLNCTAYETPPLAIWKDLKYERHVNILTKKIDKASIFIINNNFLLIFLWRSGIWISLLAITSLFIIKNKVSNLFLLYLPVLSNVVSLVLSSGWMDYRYGWSVLLTVPFITFVTVSESNSKIKE